MPMMLIALTLFSGGDEKPRVLFLTHSAGYKHSCIPLAEKKLAQMGFEVDVTQDCGTITRENLAKYRAVVFYTTGEIPIDVDALLDFVRGGGGFVGIHPATDTLYKSAGYHEMIGATFDGHPWHQKVRVKVEDTAHTATAHLDGSFDVTDEIYQFKDWDRTRVHVLMSLDAASVDLEDKGVNRTDKDFALAWTKSYGRGRVFYSALGHREEVWQDDRFLKFIAAGVRWTFGDGVDDEGFTPIFDKDHADGWKQAGPGGFKIENGVATPHGGMGLWWFDREFRNAIVKLEFQQEKIESNSGVFIRFPDPGDDPWVAVKKGYEVQIAGDAPSKNSTGAIYDFKAATEIPLKPAGEWNEYEIACVGAKTVVRLNGKLINEFEGDRGPQAGGAGPAGRIGIQNHNDKDVVRFRNIRVKELPESAAAYRVLFEGDTKGWKQCGPGSFDLKDGVLTSQGGMGMLWHEAAFKDFILMLDWKVERKEDNSGVFVRFPDPGDDPWIAVNKGYEIQICDTAEAKHRTGSLYSFEDSKEIPTKPAGEWNHYEIAVVGQKYTVRINGTIVGEYTGERALEGCVGLQNHSDGDRVGFRNIRVVELKRD